MKKHVLILLCAILLIPWPSYAASATWKPNPTSEDWNTAVNWNPATVPNGSGDTATFAASNRTSVTLSAGVEVNGIVFNPDASGFTIEGAGGQIVLTISGAGVVNNSPVTQNFVARGDLLGNQMLFLFQGSANAGTLTNFTVEGGKLSQLAGGTVIFLESSQAGGAIFTVNGAGVGNAFGGKLLFEGEASAAEGTFTVNGGTNRSAGGGEIAFSANASAGHGAFRVYGGAFPDADGGLITFTDSSSADHGVFTTNGPLADGPLGSLVQFADFSTAGNATLIANASATTVSGGFWFTDSSNGGRARVKLYGNGGLSIASDHVLPGITIGSLEGTGEVGLGAAQLSIGSNSLSTTFSGSISDVPPGGSIAKIGSGTLTLSGADSDYIGGTVVSEGTLVVSNEAGSATGTGPVQVNGGTLGGSGIISGPVTIGTGNGPGAFLAPAAGSKEQATLTIQGALTFQSDATYTYTFRARRNQSRTDQVVANGVTIDSGASFNLSGKARGTLTQGAVLPVISNTAATPIAGAFSNLPEGAIVNVNGNNLQASYDGGDGNDLTLTVVP